MTSSTVELRLFILFCYLPPVTGSRSRRTKRDHRPRINIEHEVAAVASPHRTYDFEVDVKSRPVHRDMTCTDATMQGNVDLLHHGPGDAIPAGVNNCRLQYAWFLSPRIVLTHGDKRASATITGNRKFPNVPSRSGDEDVLLMVMTHP
jgi:hypothetical protein